MIVDKHARDIAFLGQFLRFLQGAQGNMEHGAGIDKIVQDRMAALQMEALPGQTELSYDLPATDMGLTPDGTYDDTKPSFLLNLLKQVMSNKAALSRVPRKVIARQGY